MTLIDWMMESPYLAAAVAIYVGVCLMTAKVEITIRIGDREKGGKDHD